ncbi:MULTISPECIES: CPBP family intramembrane glutamic endopeptidase [Streptomyces]|uniref:CPBP family intramembrane glutamic endopeptidase n=1 Tax=Streptomyces TaxID=1883 RepID=UPI002249056E|nr:CPBP family intramembrane glutamic endopeptidase [Streptomyces sp. JHD 1]MCX2967719.1 lysostaphin resistance A-like protein [Streptomyces sp. JHD 1]
MGVGRETGAALGVLAAAQVAKARLAPGPGNAVSVVATAALAGVARRAGLTRAQVGLGADGLARGARHGAVAACCVAGAYACGTVLPATRALFADRRAAPDLPGLLRQALLDVPVGTVLLEEAAFRGVLPALLARRWGTRRADAVAAALFGLWHVAPSAALVEANPALARASAAGVPAGSGAARWATAAGNVAAGALGGLALGALRRRGGLLAPALAHTALNAFGFVAAHLVGRARREAAR